MDAGQAVNQNVAVRFNAMYENSDTFRDFGHFERYGFNPTVTLLPSDDTKIKLSYEFYHDFRLADRGNPSQGLAGRRDALQSDRAVCAERRPLDILRQPDLQQRQGRSADRHGRDRARFRQRPDCEERIDLCRLQPRIPERLSGRHRRTGSAGGGAVTPDQTKVSLNAYQNYTPRENAFNQTDFVYKTATGPVLHTVAFGTEFGRQTGLSQRNSGQFPNGALPSPSFVTVNPFNPTYFGPVTFNHIASDANSKYRLNIRSGYVQDQIEATRWLQFLVGASLTTISI